MKRQKATTYATPATALRILSKDAQLDTFSSFERAERVAHVRYDEVPEQSRHSDAVPLLNGMMMAGLLRDSSVAPERCNAARVVPYLPHRPVSGQDPGLTDAELSCAQLGMEIGVYADPAECQISASESSRPTERRRAVYTTRGNRNEEHAQNRKGRSP